MLTLRTNNYQFDRLIAHEYTMTDRYISVGGTQVPGVGYIRMKELANAFMPLAFNEIGILNRTYCISTDDQLTETIHLIESDVDTISNTRAGYLRIYTRLDNIDNVVSKLIETELFKETPTGVPELYSKCMEQVKLRQELMNDVKIKVLQSKDKHVVVQVTNYSDDQQASDIFLTLGLTPILFPDWKEKFSDKEIEYFKVLVNRSQVKRIANQKAQDAFLDAVLDTKYSGMVMRMQLQTTIDNLINQQINSARGTMNNANRQAETLLAQYNDVKHGYYEAQKLLENLEQNKENTTQEFMDALKIEGIVNVELDGDMLIISFKDYYTFYNVDEVECILNSIEPTWLYNLFKDVFVDQKYRMCVYNKFYFGVGQNTRFQEPGQIGSDELSRYNAMFNPHTHFYNCLGDYKPQLVDANARKDLYMFNTLALASTRSINFRDGAVINRWKEYLVRAWNEYNMNYSYKMLLESKCLVDAEGVRYSIYELYLDSDRDTDAIELDVEDL